MVTKVMLWMKSSAYDHLNVLKTYNYTLEIHVNAF